MIYKTSPYTEGRDVRKRAGASQITVTVNSFERGQPEPTSTIFELSLLMRTVRD